MNLEDMRHREITRYLQSIKESLNWQDKYTRLTALINDDERAEKDFFAMADSAISAAYPGTPGWWGMQSIQNYGILRGAIEKTIREAISGYRAELKEVVNAKV